MTEIEEYKLIDRIEMYYNNDREQVELEEATWKYVTLFDEDGNVTEQYSMDIIDGIDPEKEVDTEDEL